jgi:hypothetical protein
VDGVVDGRGDFAVHVEVPQVGTGNGPAGETTAGWIEGSLIRGVLGVLDGDLAPAGEQRSVARVPCRHHAVEHVDAGRDALHEILRRPDSHEVAGAVGGQQRRREVERIHHLVLRLADGEAADRDAVEGQRGDLLHAALAQVGVDAALDDAEERGA